MEDGYNYLIHVSDKFVDVVLPFASITTLDECSEFPSSEPRGGVAQVKGVQEVVDLLEVRSDSDNLMDNVLDRDDTIFTEVLLDDGVVVQRDSLLVDLAVTTLVDEFTYGLQVGLTVCDIRLNQLKHLGGCSGDLDKDTVVDLEQSQKLKDLAGFGCDFVNTPQPDNEIDLWL